MTENNVTIRQAQVAESDVVATISRTSREHFLPYLPDLHSLDGDKSFFRNRVFSECEVWVAEQNQTLVGFCAFQTGWVDHLYLLPDFVGKSIGTTLLNTAKQRHDHLQLWVFQQNRRAIGFYEHNGFKLVKETDGSSNEEKTPDALYQWRR